MGGTNRNMTMARWNATCASPTTQKRHTFVSHSRGYDGFVTLIVLVPDLNIAFLWMKNSEHSGLTVGRSAEHAVMDYFLQPEK
jgi:hypothetical protein